MVNHDKERIEGCSLCQCAIKCYITSSNLGWKGPPKGKERFTGNFVALNSFLHNNLQVTGLLEILFLASKNKRMRNDNL